MKAATPPSLDTRVDALANGVSASPQCRAAFDHVYDIDWSRNPLDPRNLIRLPADIRELVQLNRYHVVHVHTPVAGFVVRFALRRQKEPRVVYTAHGFHFHRSGGRLTTRRSSQSRSWPAAGRMN